MFVCENFQDFGVMMIPTVPGPPPKLQTSPPELKDFNERAFILQSIAGLSGCCQVCLPLCLCVMCVCYNIEINYISISSNQLNFRML